MGTVESVKVDNQGGRGKSGILFPVYGLADSIAVAGIIHNKAGGYATREQLAAFLDYSSTENGAFWSRISSAKLYGLIREENGQLKLTQTAQNILMPESVDQQRAALIEAFFAVPLFKAIYDEYQGKGLPEGLGLQNALRNRFKVIPKRVDLAIRTFYEAAERANFFETKGSKTQLIIPVINKAQPKPPAEKNDEDGGAIGSGGGGGEPPIVQSKSQDELKNEYIGTLIGAFREKSKQGEIDKELMNAIERLLDIKAV